MAVIQGPGKWRGASGSLQNSGEPPDRIDVEHRLTALETRLDTVLPTLATKADLADIKAEVAKASAESHKGFSDMVKWMVGVAFTGIAVLISAITFVGKDRPAQQSTQTQPIIINVPAPQGNPQPVVPSTKR